MGPCRSAKSQRLGAWEEKNGKKFCIPLGSLARIGRREDEECGPTGGRAEPAVTDSKGGEIEEVDPGGKLF